MQNHEKHEPHERAEAWRADELAENAQRFKAFIDVMVWNGMHREILGLREIGQSKRG